MITVLLGLPACGGGGGSSDGDNQAFCDDWEVVIDSFFEALDSLSDEPGAMPVEAAEAGRVASLRLREMDWPSGVSEAMSSYFTMNDAGAPMALDASELEEWRDVNREIHDYLDAQCDIDQGNLERWFQEPE